MTRLVAPKEKAPTDLTRLGYRAPAPDGFTMLGYEARLSEREQSGRTMFRVRVGPYEKRDEAEAAKEKLTGAGVEASLVRVQK